MSERSRPSAAFWITVALVALLVTYPLTFGPACWISSRTQPSGQLVSTVYCPVLLAWHRGPRWIKNAIWRYARVGSSGITIETVGSRVFLRFT